MSLSNQTIDHGPRKVVSESRELEKDFFAPIWVWDECRNKDVGMNLSEKIEKILALS